MDLHYQTGRHGKRASGSLSRGRSLCMKHEEAVSLASGFMRLSGLRGWIGLYHIIVPLIHMTVESRNSSHVRAHHHLPLTNIPGLQTSTYHHESLRGPRHCGSCIQRLCLANCKFSPKIQKYRKTLTSMNRSVLKTRWTLWGATAVPKRNGRLWQNLLLCQSPSLNRRQLQRRMLWILLDAMAALRSDRI